MSKLRAKLCPEISGQNIYNKGNLAKLGKTRKLLFLLWHIFDCYQQFNSEG